MDIGKAIISFSNFIWGTPLLILLLGGGIFFLFYIRFAPFRYLGHAVGVLTGRYDDPDEAGQINHYEALSTAIAGTVGMGNVSGVAVAIVTGGPGAIFWMWISALIGVATKFFTSTLAVMYRGEDDSGEVQGGPMYVIREGLGKKWNILAIAFSLFAMVGVSPMFQANQLAQIIQDAVLVPNGFEKNLESNLMLGFAIMLIVGLVIIGGIKRIGKVAGKLVPVMVILYVLSVVYVMAVNYDKILPSLWLIFEDAFSAKSAMGGALGALIITGVKRAAFSNEAGIGTAPMAHGAAKTNEPVREGLVAMLGPIIDTIIVCTMTALAIIVTGVWKSSDTNGVTLTATAFEQSIPLFGPYILTLAVSVFAFTTLFAFPYYGRKSFAFLFGTKYSWLYMVFYLMSIPLAAVVKLKVVISLFDSAYALMAFPTMISALVLAPKVKAAADDYFRRYRSGEMK